MKYHVVIIFAGMGGIEEFDTDHKPEYLPGWVSIRREHDKLDTLPAHLILSVSLELNLEP